MIYLWGLGMLHYALTDSEEESKWTSEMPFITSAMAWSLAITTPRHTLDG